MVRLQISNVLFCLSKFMQYCQNFVHLQLLCLMWLRITIEYAVLPVLCCALLGECCIWFENDSVDIVMADLL